MVSFVRRSFTPDSVVGCHSHTAVNQTSPDRSPFVLTKQWWTSHVLVHVPMTSLAYEGLPSLSPSTKEGKWRSIATLSQGLNKNPGRSVVARGPRALMLVHRVWDCTSSRCDHKCLATPSGFPRAIPSTCFVLKRDFWFNQMFGDVWKRLDISVLLRLHKIYINHTKFAI